MSDVIWTAEQESAIEARDAKVLVNAAAGSGKTAVLTSRIIKRLIPDNGEEPVRADRLLVVTFTRAAAAEMRERIERGLKDELIKAAESGDMKKRRFVSNQVKHLAAAKISTIDSFCQSVVKEYFHILGVSPSFQIVQKTEEKLMRQDVFDKLSERLYKEKDSSFMLLVSKCARSGREDTVRNLVERLYDFTANLPYPEEFIENSANEYLCENGFENTAWARKHEEKITERFKLFTEVYSGWFIPDEEEKGEKSAVKILTEELSQLNSIASMPFLEKLTAMRNFGKEKLDLDNQSIKSTRDDIIAIINSMADDLGADISKLEETLKKIFYPQARALADVTLKFLSEMTEAKKKNSVLSFSDIERMTYRLLAENDGVREEIKRRYDEILIDEYQDTNALQDGIFEMITDGKNLFMVGDMKQSIYRFRGSEPLVFRNKSDRYKNRKNSKERKISLTKNFRSRNEVLRSVNDLFEQCMSRVVGELEYDKKQRLNLGNDGYTKTGDDYKSEFVLLARDTSGENVPQRAELEAEYIAKRIVEMKKNNFKIRDKIKVEEDGVTKTVDGVRTIKNSDILILMSSHKTDGRIFSDVLSRYGIDCYVEHEGYFTRPEIKLMMALLSAVENPQRDIPLVAVMRSVVGGFTDDEIALIRAHEPKKSFFDALCSVYSKYLTLKSKGNVDAGGEIFGEKVAGFVERLNLWRDKSRYMSAERMVNMLYRETGIYSFFGATDGGEATANLRLFFDRARQYEKAGYRGLFAFLRHMQKLQEGDEDLEGAGYLSGGDFVRIMTIHKSKGLEVPVVFLAGAGKKFNRKDAQGSLVMHSRLGFSMDYTDYNENVSIVSPVNDMFARTIKDELLSEEMRKLYVALTRAKEKVIVTSCIANDAKTREKLENWQTIGSVGMRNEASGATTFTDWLAPVSMNSKNWKFEFVESLECAKKEPLDKEITTTKEELPDKEKAISILTYKYPYASVGLKSKAAVSDFKGTGKSVMSEKPKFLSKKKAGGAEFGTAVHKIMETLPRERGTDKQFIERHIEALVEAGHISEELLRTLNAEKIMKFYTTDLGKRFVESKSVHSESEFEIGVDAKRLTGNSSQKGEQILLQGVIDCWFEEDDGIVLIDYKTDRVQHIDEIHEKYDIQLELYAEALEKITKKTVKEKFIYLFSLDCVVQC